MTITYLISRCERINKPERVCFQVAEWHLIGTAIRNAKWFYSTTLGMDGIQ